MSEVIIRLENVSKTFTSGDNEVEAVRNIDLEIEKGDIFGIIGCWRDQMRARSM